MITPHDFVSMLAVATKKGRARWLRDDATDDVLCVLPNEIVRLTVQHAADREAEIESMWLLVRGVQLLCLPGSDAGQVLLALLEDATDDRGALAEVKRCAADEAMKNLQRLAQ